MTATASYEDNHPQAKTHDKTCHLSYLVAGDINKDGAGLCDRTNCPNHAAKQFLQRPICPVTHTQYSMIQVIVLQTSRHMAYHDMDT